LTKGNSPPAPPPPPPGPQTAPMSDSPETLSSSAFSYYTQGIQWFMFVTFSDLMFCLNHLTSGNTVYLLFGLWLSCVLWNVGGQ